MNPGYRVKHYGNTANNAYFNHLILAGQGQRSTLPIFVFSETHAMSKPAWEEVDFTPPGPDWLDVPNWSDVIDGQKINRLFLARSVSGKLISMMASLGKCVSKDIVRSRWFKKIVVTASKIVVVARWGIKIIQGLAKSLRTVIEFSTKFLPARQPRTTAISVFYGTSFLRLGSVGYDFSKSVFFEHGTLRWSTDSSYSDPLTQEKWRAKVAGARHLWVTNLDPPSLEMADEIAFAKWAACPHPYKFFQQPGTPGLGPKRADLMSFLDADFLVFMPASQNWKTPHHNKGSNLAWRAVASLRKDGLRVGVVASDWGLDIKDAKALVEKLGIAKHVLWNSPLPRIPMLRLLNEVDVCWDQFVIQAFGGVALRAIESGTPLLGQGLSPEAQKLTGFQVPWHIASNANDIAESTLAVYEQRERIGRRELSEATKATYHSWFNQHHSAQLVSDLQNIVFERIVNDNHEPIPSDLWARATSVSSG